jgi:hypothetical protein
MREMNFTILMQDVVLRCNKLLSRTGSTIQLSLPYALSKLLWHDRSLERLLERLTYQASLAVDPGKHVRIAVRQRKRMRDLEKFLGIHPSHWIQLRIARQGPSGFEGDARQILEDLGYCCEEWIGVKGSWPQMGAFSFGTKHLLKLVFWTQWHNNVQQCELLIPVMQPSS